MKKQWLKISDSKFTFHLNENETGIMELLLTTNTSRANCNIGEKKFAINRTGFWKSNIEITSSDGVVILKSHPENRYSNTSLIEFENKAYKLVIRNNPLAEFAITENDHDVLVYRLDTGDKQLQLKIISSEKSNIIFDFLLWYLFSPIAHENFGETYSFLTT